MKGRNNLGVQRLGTGHQSQELKETAKPVQENKQLREFISKHVLLDCKENKTWLQAACSTRPLVVSDTAFVF